MCWVLPSLHRPQRLHSCLVSMKETGVETPGIIILGADQQSDAEDIRRYLPSKWTVRCQDVDDHSLADVLNRFVREHPDLPYYGYLQDDLIFHTLGWDWQLVAAAGKTGMASSNDEWNAPRRNVGAGAFGGDLIRAWGFWAPPGVRHCYMDDFWEDVGNLCGNWQVLMKVRQTHFHWANYHGARAPMDDVYQVALDQMPEDGRLWEAYKATADYAALLERVQAVVDAGYMHMEMGRAL